MNSEIPSLFGIFVTIVSVIAFVLFISLLVFAMYYYNENTKEQVVLSTKTKEVKAYTIKNPKTDFLYENEHYSITSIVPHVVQKNKETLYTTSSETSFFNTDTPLEIIVSPIFISTIRHTGYLSLVRKRLLNCTYRYYFYMFEREPPFRIVGATEMIQFDSHLNNKNVQSIQLINEEINIIFYDNKHSIKATFPFYEILYKIVYDTSFIQTNIGKSLKKGHVMNIVPVDFDATKELQQYCEHNHFTLQSMEEYKSLPKHNSLLLHKATYEAFIANTKPNFDTILNLKGNAKEIVFCGGIKDRIIVDPFYKPKNVGTHLDADTITSIIRSGYSYRLDHKLLLDKKYLLEPSCETKSLFTIMPNKIERSVFDSTPTSIPKIIHQSFSNRGLSEGLIHAVHTWVNINPEYEYRFYDNKDRREFIETHFDKDVLKAYDMLIPGAYQCDLWRYCVIYIHGGIYADIKNGAVYPIHDFLKPEVDYFFINDCGIGAVYNACFGAKPKSPLLLKLIQLVVQRVFNKEYGESTLYPTGPLAMGKIIFEEYNFKYRIPKGTYKIGNETICVYNHYHYIFNLNGTTRLDNDNKVVIYERHNKNVNKGIQHITGNAHYSILWEQKKIYRDS